MDKSQTKFSGAELRARRHAMSLTQRQLGAELGVDQNSIARWERGGIAIAHPKLLAAALDLIEQRLAHGRRVYGAPATPLN